MWVFGLVDTTSIYPNNSKSCHTSSNYSNPCCTWYNCAFQRVECIQESITFTTCGFTRNHSVTFVDPTTGIHTQHVESYWNRPKLKFKKMKDVTLTRYLAIWMNSCGGNDKYNLILLVVYSVDIEISKLTHSVNSNTSESL